MSVIEGDEAEPDVLLPLLKEAVDFGQPVGLVLGMVMQHLEAQQAREVAAAYLKAMAPGSYLVISCPTCDDPELWKRLSSARAVCAQNHSPSVVETFFAGTELVGPGLVLARAWKPQRGPVGMRPDAAAYILAGVGRKP